jgi:hypothetical protein
VVSITIVVVLLSTSMLVRRRLSFESGDVHTGQLQATIGTPVLVPVPKKVIFNGGQNINLE